MKYKLLGQFYSELCCMLLKVQNKTCIHLNFHTIFHIFLGMDKETLVFLLQL